jgi:orotidine-5'-phosphate decarboxylase
MVSQYWPFAALVRQGSLKERLIVSLDLGTRREAIGLVERLGRSVGMFKVGKHLFLNGGPDLVRDIRRHGAEVFLDLKFHDTPQGVCKAAIEATRLGVRMFDLHSYGSFEVMERVRADVARVCRNEGLRRPSMLAVAMLTCLRPGERIMADNEDRVVRLAKLAAEASLDGVLTTAQEAARVRALCGRRFIIVTSGLKLDESRDLRTRPTQVSEAIRAGADYIVVGSPIWNAPEPLRAVREIIEEMERGMRASPRGTLELLSPRPG